MLTNTRRELHETHALAARNAGVRAMARKKLAKRLRRFRYADIVGGRRVRARLAGLRVRPHYDRIRKPTQRDHRAHRRPRHCVAHPTGRRRLARVRTAPVEKTRARADARLIRGDVPVRLDAQELAIGLLKTDGITCGGEVVYRPCLDGFDKLCWHPNAAIDVVRTKPQFFASRAQFMARES